MTLTDGPVAGPRTPALDAVRAQLEQAILSGSLPAGSRINADECARRMGVSHIPVREALRSLQGDGWVVHRPNRGAFVRDRDPVELTDLFEARIQIEGDTALLAAQRRTAAQLDALDSVLAHQARLELPGDLAEVNCIFHTDLAACAHNSVLHGYVADLNKRARFYFLPAAGGRRSSSLAEHRAILDAVRHRDGDGARRLLRAHIDDTRASALLAMDDEVAARPG